MPGPDGVLRTPWALGDPLLMDYYDNEWGRVVRDEQGLFERICLEAFQAGLSWITVLRKRDALRARFLDFNPDACAKLSDVELEDALSDAGIIRNRAKVFAVRTNAVATRESRSSGGLSNVIWSFQPVENPRPRTTAEVPTTSPESVAMARELKKRGFVFVGPTTAYALMEAIGMVDTHVMDSHYRGIAGI